MTQKCYLIISFTKWNTFGMKMTRPRKSWYPGGIIFNFSPHHIFWFSKMADHVKKKLSTLPGGFSGWENHFYGWNYSFFNPNIFSNFPRWWTKNHKKGNFLHYLGGFQVKKKWKTFLWIKNFFFSPRYIFRFFKMANQKTLYNALFTTAEGFWG